MKDRVAVWMRGIVFCCKGGNLWDSGRMRIKVSVGEGLMEVRWFAEVDGEGFIEKVVGAGIWEDVKTFSDAITQNSSINLRIKNFCITQLASNTHQYLPLFSSPHHSQTFPPLQQNPMYVGKAKSSWPSLQPMWNWDKRLLDRGLDKSWCHRHSSVEIFWSQPMNPWTWVAAHPYAADDVHGVMSCDQKKLYNSVVVTPAPVRIPTYPMATCSEFHIGCRLGQELFTLPS